MYERTKDELSQTEAERSKVLLEDRNRTFSECYCRVLNSGLKQTDFVVEIQVAVLQVELTRRIWGPAGSAQHSEHLLLPERYARLTLPLLRRPERNPA